jgi:lysozyme family protein
LIHPYERLKAENAGLLSSAQILPSVRASALAVAKRLIASRPRYETIQQLTTVKVTPCACIHERECDADFRCALCNGERIIGTGRKTTLVPRNHGPYATFEQGAQDAFHIDGLDKVAAMAEGWTAERAVYEQEAYNGFGPRDHGRHTGYNWAGTNIYNGGKYVADGVWNPNAWDTQLGCVTVALAIAELAPDLALPRAGGAPALPVVAAPSIVPKPQAVPIGHGGGELTTSQIQSSLNQMGCNPPLQVNGNYDRFTRIAVGSFQKWAGLTIDGLVGDLTTSAMKKTLQEMHL